MCGLSFDKRNTFRGYWHAQVQRGRGSDRQENEPKNKNWKNEIYKPLRVPFGAFYARRLSALLVFELPFTVPWVGFRQTC